MQITGRTGDLLAKHGFTALAIYCGNEVATKIFSTRRLSGKAYDRSIQQLTLLHKELETAADRWQ